MRIFLFLMAFGYFLSCVGGATAQEHADYKELQDILRVVYNDNPTLMAAREELKKTQELYPQARSGWLPSINGETSMYATDIESSNFSNGDGATTKDMTISLDQPIWRGGQTFAETKRARDLIRAGDAILRQAEQDIILETVTVYMNVLRDKELLDLRLQNEQILQQELDAAHERKEIGDFTNTDVQQAKARLLRAQSDYIRAMRNLEISKSEFEDIAGISPPHTLRIPYIDLQLPDQLDVMIDLAEQQNPELQIAQFQQSAADHNADARFRELLPQVSAFASFNRQYDPQPGIVSESETETIGLRASISLYKGGSTRSRIREAKREATQQIHKITETRRRIRQEVTSNWRSFIAAQSQMENRTAEIEAAEAALKGVREESHMGQRTLLDVLNADQELINARVALTSARRNQTVAEFALAGSLGLLNTQTLILAQ